MAEFYKN